MKIALGSDHRGAAYAKLLTRNIFLPNHYSGEDGRDDIDRLMPGAVLIENAALDAGAVDAADSAVANLTTLTYSRSTAKDLPVISECVDYPDVAAAVSEAVATGKADRGVLICGTGIGMCITANKFHGIRAALCINEVCAELSRRHNNSNVICLSGDLLSPNTIQSIVQRWLTTDFDGGRHARRVDLISEIERDPSKFIK